MPPKRFRTALPKLLLAFAFAVSCASATNLYAAAEQGGPTTLIITYRCAPANRAAFRQSIEKTDINRFEKWKSDGVVENYRLLFNWYADENTWDMMAILSFSKYANVGRWKEIERTSPGGLSQESLKLGAPTNTYSADLNQSEVSQSAPGNSGKSVFFVVPYDVLSTVDEYKTYAAGYVIPQTKGWIREGILTSYSLYLNRYYPGKPWDAMLVLEYKDLESFGQRESVIAKVRQTLSADPKWKAIGDNKKSIRSEKEPTLADELTRR